MKNEYVIWGIPQGQKEEVLLLTSINGERIEDRDRAERLLIHLQNVHNCSNCRVQEVNLEDNKIQLT